MIKRMTGDRRDWSYPVIVENDIRAVTDRENAELMVNTFVKIQSSNNLSGEGNRGSDI